MNTKLLQADAAGLSEAARLLRDGQLVGMPTETVYGLAADALNGPAVASIFAAKGRPQDNPLIVHIETMAALPSLVREVPEAAQRLAQAYWPGPLTMIFPKGPAVPDEVTAGLDTVAVRMPSHPVAQALIRGSGCPLAAPSANRSGSPSPTTARRVMEDMAGRIAAVVDGGPCAVGVESTVVDMTARPPRLLRPGGITPAMLRAVVGEIVVDSAVTAPLAQGAKAASPGMKYKHYAPSARVVLVKGTPAAYAAFVNAQVAPGVGALCLEEDRAALNVPCVTYGSRSRPESQAAALFDALRRLDEQGITTAYAVCPAAEELSLAVYNRLLRAAGFEVIEL